jgi:hypothetical protein
MWSNTLDFNDKKKENKKEELARHQWLTPVILATRGRDQEDHSLKPAQENSSQDPISKNSSQKRAGGVAQGVGPE